ncbi:MAG TPA: pitrilysin family protein [Patescibacteria group bacterium]|nr:pitrilysin family protein [Patescibacteria group bacterium]
MNTRPPIQKTLSSGLTIILAPMEVQSVSVLAFVGTGSRFETEETSGISHFLEHMVFKGTHKYPTPKVLAETIDRIGAEFNAFTSKEYTGYYVKAASEHANLALDVVSDMLLTPTLKEDDLQREKGVIVEEIHMYEDTPARHIGDVFERLFFSGSTLGRDIIGTENTVRSFSREHFQNHLSRWYGLSNVVVTVSGDSAVVNDALIAEIERAFSKQSETRTSQATEAIITSITGDPISNGKKIEVAYKDTQQAHFVMAVEGLKRRDSDQYALSVLSTLFGGNMSSRLFTEVREKRGLCYYVRSDEDTYHDAGIFGASAGVDPARVDEAVKVVREELYKLTADSGEGKITDKEVDDAKSHAVGSAILHIEDSLAVAQFYGGHKLLRNELITPQEEIERIRAVTSDDVRRVAKRLLSNSELFFAIIGPYKEEDRFAKLIQL